MSIFLALLIAIIPLYIIILLGFLAGRFIQVKKESIASVAIYIVTPVVVFNGTYTSQISLSVLSLPFLTLLIAGFICLLF